VIVKFVWAYAVDDGVIELTVIAEVLGYIACYTVNVYQWVIFLSFIIFIFKVT